MNAGLFPTPSHGAGAALLGFQTASRGGRLEAMEARHFRPDKEDIGSVMKIKYD